MAYRPKVLNGLSGGTGIANADASTLTLGGALTTSGTFATTFTMSNTTSVTFPTSGTLATTAQIPSTPISLANGGTAASLTASNGGIFYSTASAGAILAGTATAGQLLTSGASTTPAWTTSTYPATNAISTLLYASSANVMAALATANSGVLITSSGGVPSISSTLPSGIAATNMSLTTPTLGAASATSINFGGTSLSVYAEGTFTPGISFGGGTTGITYGAQVGFYTKIGRCVYYTINIALTSKGSSSGNAEITGLPFAQGTNGANYGSCCNLINGFTQVGAIDVSFVGQASTSNFYVIYNTIAGASFGLAQNTAFGNTTQLVSTGFYFTN